MVQVTTHFFATTLLTFIGRMGKIRENGRLGRQDKIGILKFLPLTCSVKPGNLGDLDKCDIVESLGNKRVKRSIISGLGSGG